MKAVRICLMQRDLSFSAYCHQNGYTRQNLAAALTGKWTGPKAKTLVSQVLTDLGLAS
jgi:predicted CxxxxCH...CXXCH cytochrome family protein